MDAFAMIVFLRFIQRIQILVVNEQKRDPTFNDVNRCANLVYNLTFPPVRERQYGR